MTRLLQHTYFCANCGGSSKQTQVVSTNTFGGPPDLDTRPAEMQRSTMRHWLARCPHCGYCAPKLDTLDVESALIAGPEYRETLADERMPELARCFCARALLVAGKPPEAARAYLCAAWACDDGNLVNLAAECRGRAAAEIRRISSSQNEEAYLTNRVILIDVLRRCGHWDEAREECKALLLNPLIQGPLRQALQQQFCLIRDNDLIAHRIEPAPVIAEDAKAVSRFESRVLSRELGRLGGSLTTCMARILPNDSQEKCFEVTFNRDLAMLKAAEFLLGVGVTSPEIPFSFEEGKFCVVTGSGRLNLNPALLAVSITDKNGSVELMVRAVAKEGLIKQRSAANLIERILPALRAALN